MIWLDPKLKNGLNYRSAVTWPRPWTQAFRCIQYICPRLFGSFEDQRSLEVQGGALKRYVVAIYKPHEAQKIYPKPWSNTNFAINRTPPCLPRRIPKRESGDENHQENDRPSSWLQPP